PQAQAHYLAAVGAIQALERPHVATPGSRNQAHVGEQRVRDWDRIIGASAVLQVPPSHSVRVLRPPLLSSMRRRAGRVKAEATTYFCLLFHSRTAISKAVPAIGRPMK